MSDAIPTRKRKWELEHKRWLERKFCVLCRVEVSRSHWRDHTRSAAHQRAAAYHWDLMPSDEAFTQFLHSVSVRSLHGYERRLYYYYQSPESQAKELYQP